MSEHNIQTSYFDVLRLNEGKFPILKGVFAVPNGGARHIATAVKLRREGVKSGVFDVCIPFARSGFNLMFIEFKFGKNNLTNSQIDFLNLFKDEKTKFEVCWSVWDALDKTGKYLGIDLKI